MTSKTECPICSKEVACFSHHLSRMHKEKSVTERLYQQLLFEKNLVEGETNEMTRAKLPLNEPAFVHLMKISVEGFSSTGDLGYALTFMKAEKTENAFDILQAILSSLHEQEDPDHKEMKDLIDCFVDGRVCQVHERGVGFYLPKCTQQSIMKLVGFICGQNWAEVEREREALFRRQQVHIAAMTNLAVKNFQGKTEKKMWYLICSLFCHVSYIHGEERRHHLLQTYFPAFMDSYRNSARDFENSNLFQESFLCLLRSTFKRTSANDIQDNV